MVRDWTRAMLVAWASVAMAQPVAGDGEAAPSAAGLQEEIPKLIAQLGDDRWRVREAATQRLSEIGTPAEPALREAVQSPDLEVKARAQSLLNAIAQLAPARLAAQRAEVQQAFRKGDYAAAIRASKKITLYEKAEMLDWLWLGHSCQLAGDWAQAVQAYRKVVTFIDADIAGGIKEEAPPAPPGDGAKERTGPVRGDEPPRLSEQQRKKLINQRTMLMVWIARLQRGELKDSRSAAATLAEAVEHLEKSKTEIDYTWQMTVQLIPPLLHEAGDPAGAIEAWKRAVATRQRAQRGFLGDWLVDVQQVYASLESLPAGSAVPDVPWIISLDPDNPSVKLDLDDPATRGRSYQPGLYSYYAFAPPRGKEFATIEFACDIEQLKVRWGGHFYCFVAPPDGSGKARNLGGIGWPPDKTEKGEIGREVVKRTFAIPPGARLVHVRVGNSEGHFAVHSLSATATFRPVTNDPKPILADAWMQTELHPSTGTITWGSMKLQNERAYSGVAAGRHTLRFAAPPRAETVEMPFEVKPGRRYGLFVNLDSPFRWRQLDLELKGSGHAEQPRFSTQRLPNGEYLAVWSGRGRKLLTARSKDLIEWTPPTILPLCSVFDNIEPATFRSPDGTIHLAFFCNRLSTQMPGTGGHHLWITRTRDGKTWEPPRRIEIGGTGGWPPSTASMLTGPDGKQWLFWRDRAAAAGSLDEIRELVPIEIAAQKRENLFPCNVHVSLDAKGRFHMVYDSATEGILHMTSADGSQWSRPNLLLAKAEGTSTEQAQLIFVGGRPLLLYSAGGSGYLTPVDLDGKPVAPGSGLKVTCRLVPLAGAKAFRDGDDLVLLVGADTTWLLRAKLKDLQAAAAGTGKVGANQEEDD